MTKTSPFLHKPKNKDWTLCEIMGRYNESIGISIMERRGFRDGKHAQSR